MRKVMVTVLAMCLALLVGAQTEKGTFLIGATTDVMGSNPLSLVTGVPNTVVFSFSSSKWKSDEGDGEAQNVTAFNIGPRFGVFVVDNLLLGINLDINYYKYGDDDAINSFGGGPALRYYFTDNKLKPFAAADASFGTFKWGDSKSNTIDVQAGGGVAFFFSDHVSLDVLAGYIYSQSKDPDSDIKERLTQNGFGIGLGLSIFL